MGNKKIKYLLAYPAFGVFIFLGSFLKAQDQTAIFKDSVTIRECISYAFVHQPLVSQLKIDEEVAEKDIKIAFADWYPQITSNAGFQYYMKQPVAIFPNPSDPTGPKTVISTGVSNNSNLQLNATQKIFDNNLLFAVKSAKYYRRQVTQSTLKAKIQLVVDISKAYYDILLTQEMLNIINDDIERLTKSLEDAQAMYKNGLRDKTDYSRATLALNSVQSQKISVKNSITAKITYLKQLMGYPDNEVLTLKHGFNDMESNVMIDTLQSLKYNERIEFQQLQTNVALEKLMIGYNKQSILPTLSGYATYNANYLNDKFGQLYDKTYPNSFAGLSLSFPLFEGTKRIQNIRKSKLLYDRLVLDTINLKNEMNSGYIDALSTYKSNLAAYNLTTQNIALAREVYNTIEYQYKEGIKPYLEVIVAETDLRSTELNNLSAMIMLMFSKIDLEQALGKISIDY